MGINICQSCMDFRNPHRIGGAFSLSNKRITFDIRSQHRVQQTDLIGRGFLFNPADTVMRWIFNTA